jgi:hypothetical protein
MGDEGGGEVECIVLREFDEISFKKSHNLDSLEEGDGHERYGGER